MKAVFLDTKTFRSNISFTSLKSQVTELTCYETTTPEQVVKRCQAADIVITNKVVLNHAILTQLPQLKLICVAATGMNNIDLESAKQLNITVKNVQNYAGSAIAQYVFAQLLAHFQQIDSHNNAVKQGLWQQSDTFCVHGAEITELASKTIGIIGYGNLGKSVAKVAQAFGMKVLISEHKNAKQLRTGRTAFNEVLAQSDIISLHCPQTPQTVNLLSTNELALMKKNTILINTARGALIDEQALVNTLSQQKIALAIIDVLSQEPPSADNPLLNYQRTSQHNNLVISAHIAWASTQAQQRLINELSINIEAFKNQHSIHH